MSAAILSIGTEVVRGEIENTNSSWLCDRLTGLGVVVAECVSVPDDPQLIVQTLRRLAASHELVVSTGGLGPTTDDLTTVAVATTLGVSVVRDEASLTHIKGLFTRAGYEFSESNAKQADFPEGARILRNHWGSAPGFSMEIDTCLAFFFPGVPREMKPMFDAYVVTDVQARLPSTTAQIRLRTFGAAESAINDRLKGVEEEYDVTLGYRAHMPQVEVKALAVRADSAAAEAAAEAAARAVEARLGDLVYGRGSRDLPQVLGDLLAQRGWTLGLAESCTGGLVSDLFVREPASAYFNGSIVCYSNDVKERLLNVPRSLLDSHGAVSEPVVRALAANVRERLGADLGIAISGIAGPDGGTADKPVGLVHFAVCSPLGTEARMIQARGDRRMIQLRAAYAALDLARRQLSAKL